MSKFIDARVIQKTGSESEWLANDLILYKGELALVTQGDRVVNIKVGNGIKKFSELPYIYNGGFTDSVTPTTQGSTLVDGMYIANGVGIYTNMGGLVVKDGYFTIISKVGTTYKITSEVKMPTPDLTPIENRITEVESSNTQLQNNVNKRIDDLETEQQDFIENFSVEVDKKFNDSDFAKKIVEKAFEETDEVNLTIGRDLNIYGAKSTNTTPFNWPLINNTFTPGAGKITKIRVNVEAAGSMKLGLCAVNPETNTMKVKQQLTYTLVAGINEISVDLAVEKGDTIGSFGGACKIRFIDETTDTGKYYSNDRTPFIWIKGAVCMNFDFEGLDETGFTVEEIKKILTKENNVSSNSDHCKIFLEGQSNALGVGALSGLLNNSPYKDVLFDWTKKFSRVFIWNPRTNSYENLQIGVNNIASWDSDYIYPSSSPTPYPTFGSEIGFAIIWENSTKKGNLYISKGIGDGRPISFFQKGTTYYTELLSRNEKSEKWLKERGIFAKSIGFVWVQGESDAGASSVNYETALRVLINDRIADGIIDVNCVKVITQIGTTSKGYSSTVAAGKNQYVSKDLTSVIVNYPPYYNSDNLHLDYRGELILGINSANYILFANNLTFEQLETKNYWTF